LAAAIAAVATACGGSDSAEPGSTASTDTTPSASETLDGVVKIDGDRGLYVRCSGEGSPTIILEGGDEDTSASYAFAEARLAETTRTCVYDRANLGRSDPSPGPRGLAELVADLERLLEAAEIPPPYVLVGTSGGGYITAGYAVAHPEQTAGMVFIDVAAPYRNPPPEILAETDPGHPDNVEQRDYLQVEKDAWAARAQVGDIPVTVVSVDYSPEAEAAAEWPSERTGMQRNVQDQQGWLVLSPSAEQLVVQTSHAVEEDDPELVIDTILDVVKAAQG
jgi:pimeloyl-ACP methyl ester carboxylesterase